jgi:prophage regulatory protein
MHYLSFKGLQVKLGGRGRTTIYKDVELGRLPKPIKIGSRLYWNEADIDATLQARANA